MLREAENKRLRRKGVEMIAEREVRDEMDARDDLVSQLELRCTQAEIALEEAKERERRLETIVGRFRELHRTSPVAFFTFDQSMRIVDMNAAACGLLEMTAHGVIGLNFTALIARNGGLRFMEQFRRSRFAAKAPFKTELELTTGKRNHVIVEIAVSRMPLTDTVLYEAALLELTTHKALAHAETLAREHAEGIVTALPFPILVLDSNGRILSANSGFYHFFQTSEARVVNHHITDLPEIDWENKRLEKLLRETLSTGRPIENLPLRATLWRGSLMTLQMNARRFAIGSAGKAMLLVAFDDITRRQRAEDDRDVAMRELEAVSAGLEIRVNERTHELERSYGRLRDVGEQLILAHESEQRRIARELHDQVGQDLTALKIMLSRGKSGTSEETQKTLQEAEALTEEMLQTVRNICGTLRPQVLDDLGLVQGLQWHMKTFTERTGLEVTFDLGPMDEARLSPIVKSTVFRVIQEALTNVSRHAEAKSAWVALAMRERTVEFSIRDGGKGFDVAESGRKGSTGLSSMRERLSLVQGQFEISSLPGQGTIVRAEIPLPPPRGR